MAGIVLASNLMRTSFVCAIKLYMKEFTEKNKRPLTCIQFHLKQDLIPVQTGLIGNL